ncbi:MAG: DUF4124 domain-containing protein [Pseudomonadota bacterium]
MAGAVTRHFFAGCGLALVLALPCAAQGIYACVDGRGNRITSDRPIPECLDRTQRELNRSGTVRRQVGPNLTADERAELEEKERLAAIANARIVEVRRRDRALFVRYPNPQAHDRERVANIAKIDEVIKAANKRIAELAQQRVAADAEMEFYVHNPARAPETLKRKLSDIEGSMTIQQRFIAEQENEKKRVHARFDEERVRLQALWLPASAAKKP